MVGAGEIASPSQVMSFVHYAQNSLRLSQYLGYAPYVNTLLVSPSSDFKISCGLNNVFAYGGTVRARTENLPVKSRLL